MKWTYLVYFLWVVIKTVWILIQQLWFKTLQFEIIKAYYSWSNHIASRIQRMEVDA